MEILTVATRIAVWVVPMPPAVVLYIGPDVFLPLTSALAVVVGAVLMFWQKVVGVAASVWRSIFKPKA